MRGKRVLLLLTQQQQFGQDSSAGAPAFQGLATQSKRAWGALRISCANDSRGAQCGEAQWGVVRWDC